VLVGEAPVRVVDLHRRDAEIEQNAVHAVPPEFAQKARQPGEVGATRQKQIVTEALVPEALFRQRKLQRILIEAEKDATRLQARQDGEGMPAVTECSINDPGPRLRIQGRKDFVHQHRAMHPRRSLACGKDLGHGFGIARMFLVPCRQKHEDCGLRNVCGAAAWLGWGPD